MLNSSRLITALVSLACISLSACGGGGSSSTAYSSGAPTQVSSGSGSGTTTGATAGYTISGVVTGDSAAAIKLTGANANSASTDSNGNYSFANLGAGNYTVTPSQTGYAFSPVSRAEAVSTASLTDVVFLATANNAPMYTISGTVSGSVMAGVVITLNGSNVGSAVTDLSGNYTFSGLVGGTYTLSASLDGDSFSAPLIVNLSNTDSVSNNFTSAAATTGDLAFSQVTTLPPATIGTPYSVSVVKSVSGGTAPYRYKSGSLDAGSPPLGMIVNPNGDLTGTASVAGQYDFSVCAMDSAGETSTCVPTSITVAAAAESPPGPVPPTPAPGPAPTVTLSASPATTSSGKNSTLTWSSTNAASCAASGGWSGTKATSGTSTVTPASTTTYTLTCTGSGGVGKASVAITVAPVSPPPAPPTVSLTSSASTINSGSSTTLNWSSKNASSCVRSGGWSGTEGTSGSLNVSPGSTTTYSLACSGSGGTAQSSAKVTVNGSNPPPAPEPTVSLKANATTITQGSAATLTWSSSNASSCLASSGWSGTKSDSGTSNVSPASTTTYTLACTGAGGTAQGSVKITVNSPTSPPPASGTFWVYYNGQFDWAGDWPFSANTDYSDSSGNPLSGGHDLKISLTSQFGGWIPWAQNFAFNSAGYTKLTLALKPTSANQQWSISFVKINDVPVGITLNVLKYGPAPVPGKWGTYTIPLSDLGVLGASIYKFVLQDQSGSAGNVWYVDNVGFVP